jgi:LCP family protein required for cell wall assembly
VNKRAQGRTGWSKAGLAAGRTLVALVSAAVLSAWGVGYWAFGNADEDTVTTNVISQDVQDQRIPLDGAVDLLLVGLDSRLDAYGNPLPREVLDMLSAGVNDGERNTDTMILVHIPVDGTRAIAISFPRDSWVELAGDFGKHRLNSAFAYAYNDAREELANSLPDEKSLNAEATVRGRKNLIQTIQNLIGSTVTIDRYAEVNLASFYEVTNAIGGVEVCLNAATHDPKSGANFVKGRQTVAGAQALAFVRQRYGLPNGDLDRIVRQQAFLGALANRVLSADMLTSPGKVKQLVGAVQRSVVLSQGWQLSTFAAQMSGLNADGIDFYTIPTQGDAKIGGADVLRVDPAQVAAFVASLTTDEQDEPSSSVDPVPPKTTTTTASPPASSGDRPTLGMITVDVLNGSATLGLAAQVRDRLAGEGFQSGEIGDAPQQSTSTIRYASGERNIAEYAAGELGGRFTYEEDTSLATGALTVVLGTDFQLGGQTDGLRKQPPTGTSAPGTGGSTTGAATPKPQINAGGSNCVN